MEEEESAGPPLPPGFVPAVAGEDDDEESAGPPLPLLPAVHCGCDGPERWLASATASRRPAIGTGGASGSMRAASSGYDPNDLSQQVMPTGADERSG